MPFRRSLQTSCLQATPFAAGSHAVRILNTLLLFGVQAHFHSGRRHAAFSSVTFCRLQSSGMGFTDSPPDNTIRIAMTILTQIQNQPLVSCSFLTIQINTRQSLCRQQWSRFLRCSLMARLLRFSIVFGLCSKAKIWLPRWRSRSAREPLSFSLRANPRTWRSNPFGHGLSPYRRSISCSTCVAFLLSACLCSLLCLSLCPSLCLSLCPCFSLALRERVIFHWSGLVPVCHASLSVLLVYCLPLRSESTVPLQPRRVQSNVPALFWVLWVVCQYSCFDRVLERVRTLRFVLSHKSFPFLQGPTSVFRERLQQLHQHGSVPSSVRWLPLFQKTSTDRKSIRWIAQHRDHLECSILCMHRQHERQLSRSFLLCLVHSSHGQLSQRIRFHIHKFHIELLITRRDVLSHFELPLASWESGVTGVRAALSTSIVVCWCISWSC